MSYALAYSPELAHLAKSIQSGLGQTPYFDIHLTIGKLYEEKDRDPHSMVKVLKQALGQKLQVAAAHAQKQWIVDSFTLKGHQETLSFPLIK